MDKAELDTMVGVIGGMIFGGGWALIINFPTYPLGWFYVVGGFGIIMVALRVARNHPAKRGDE